MNFINSWTAIGRRKQTDKLNITVRIGPLTILEVKYDLSDKTFKLLKLLNEVNYKKIIIDENLNFYKKHLFLNINSQIEYKKAEDILLG